MNAPSSFPAPNDSSDLPAPESHDTADSVLYEQYQGYVAASHVYLKERGISFGNQPKTGEDIRQLSVFAFHLTALAHRVPMEQAGEVTALIEEGRSYWTLIRNKFPEGSLPKTVRHAAAHFHQAEAMLVDRRSRLQRTQRPPNPLRFRQAFKALLPFPESATN